MYITIDDHVGPITSHYGSRSRRSPCLYIICSEGPSTLLDIMELRVEVSFMVLKFVEALEMIITFSYMFIQYL